MEEKDLFLQRMVKETFRLSWMGKGARLDIKTDDNGENDRLLRRIAKNNLYLSG